MTEDGFLLRDGSVLFMVHTPWGVKFYWDEENARDNMTRQDTLSSFVISEMKTNL